MLYFHATWNFKMVSMVQLKEVLFTHTYVTYTPTPIFHYSHLMKLPENKASPSPSGYFWVIWGVAGVEKEGPGPCAAESVPGYIRAAQ